MGWCSAELVLNVEAFPSALSRSSLLEIETNGLTSQSPSPFLEPHTISWSNFAAPHDSLFRLSLLSCQTFFRKKDALSSPACIESPKFFQCVHVIVSDCHMDRVPSNTIDGIEILKVGTRYAHHQLSLSNEMFTPYGWGRSPWDSRGGKLNGAGHLLLYVSTKRAFLEPEIFRSLLAN